MTYDDAILAAICAVRERTDWQQTQRDAEIIVTLKDLRQVLTNEPDTKGD